MFVVTINQKKNHNVINSLRKAIDKSTSSRRNLGGYIKAFHWNRDESGYTKFGSSKRAGFVFAVNEGESAHCEVWENCRDADINKRYKEEAAVLESFIGCIARHCYRSLESIKIEFHPELQSTLWTRGLTVARLVELFSDCDPPTYEMFSESSKLKFLCQSFPCRFQHNGNSYESVEHWIAARKAEMFGDFESLGEINLSNHPAKIKKLSDKIKNVDNKLWHARVRDVAMEGNLLKFRSSNELRLKLKQTGEKVLVYANGSDLIFGSGLKMHDATVSSPEKWAGENMLGFILMEVRTTLNEDRYVEIR